MSGKYPREDNQTDKIDNRLYSSVCVGEPCTQGRFSSVVVECLWAITGEKSD